MLPVLMTSCLLMLGLVTLARAIEPGEHRATARNVIFMIGDGCGPAYVELGRGVKGAPLSLDPYLVGASQTAASDSRVTDSAASATALACGVQTRNEAIGVDTRGRAHRTLLEAAESCGRSTGLVATSRITHATPAAFAAHVPHRDDEDAIAAQEVEQNIELLLGAGARHFIPVASGGHRTDSRNLLDEQRRSRRHG
ncbi:MAG: alkaline phosphatase, partial [Candidatus Eisenbacteria bacterium]|nr:alkaline phosphatase [Candidatus Eisenbacteria bacterium]